MSAVDVEGKASMNAYVVTGTLVDGQTVTLDEWLPLHTTKVLLRVEALPPQPTRSRREVLAEIRRRQAARGHRPALREEVDRYIAGERDGWER